MMKMLKWWRGRYIDRQIEGGEKKKGTDRTLGWMGLLSPDKQVTCHGEQQETMELRDVKSQNGFRARVQQTLDVNKDTPGSEIQTASFASNRKGYFWGEERERDKVQENEAKETKQHTVYYVCIIIIMMQTERHAEDLGKRRTM